MFFLNQLSGTDYIARLYKFRERDELGNPSTAAFLMKLEKGEYYLSNVWLEYFHCESRKIQIDGALAALRAKRDVRPSERLAVMAIGDVLHSCAEAGTLVEVKTTGEEHDPPHTGIYGYVDVNAEIAAVLAKDVRHEIYPAA